MNNNYNNLKNVLESMPMALYVKNLENKIIYVNKVFFKTFNLTYNEVFYKNEKAILSLLNINVNIDNDIEIIREKKTVCCERTINKNENQKTYQVYKSPIFNNKNEVISIMTLYNDITCIKNREDKLEKLAYRDYLTNLLNLRGLIKYISSKSNNPNKEITLLFIDLDNFKKLNDTFGHKYGDKALKIIAKRLSEFSGNNVARIGGDEFIIIYENIGYNELMNNVSKILSLLRLKLEKNNEEVFISGSIGVVTESCNNLDYDKLIAKGDICLYKAKVNGKNQVVFDDEDFKI